MSNEIHCDAIVIGAGQAGPPLAERLGKSGREVAIVEKGKVGGTCVNYGCIPTKTLVASARAAHVARRAADFGVQIDGDVTVDMARVHARMKRISGESNENVQTWIDGMDGVTLRRGAARFVGEKRLQVDDDVLIADEVFINVGGRARVPDMPGIDAVDFLTNREMLELDELPEHLIVVGGSYIGLEFAQMFRRFGARVTVIEQGPRLIGREDEDVSDAVRQIIEGEGVNVRCDSKCIALANHDGGVRVETDCERPPVDGSHVLLAVGRVPNTDTLTPEEAGIEIDDRGLIVVDDQLRTSADEVWAMGDCSNAPGGAFTHTAYNDYEIVAANLLDGEARRATDRFLCYGLFIDPPLGRVGMTLAQARDSGRNLLVGERPMSRVGRARERSETDGFIRIVVDADSERIIGASILGVEGDEAVHSILDVMYADAPYTTISRAVHVHPAVSELIPTVLQALEPLG